MAVSASSTPISQYRSAAYYCGTNDQERLKQLVLIYTDMLATSADSTYFDRSVVAEFLSRDLSGGTLPRAEAFKAAVELAKAATIPLFFVRANYFPLHCFHLEVLSRARLERLRSSAAPAAEIDALFQRGLSDSTTASMAFTATYDEWSGPWAKGDDLRDLLHQLACVPGTRFPGAIAMNLPDLLTSAVRSDENVGPIFDTVHVLKRQLVARLLCIIVAALHDRLKDAELATIVACLAQTHPALFTETASLFSAQCIRHLASAFHRAFRLSWAARPTPSRPSSKLREADQSLRAIAELIQGLFHANYLLNSRGLVEPAVFYTSIVSSYTPQQVFDDFRFAMDAGARGEFFSFADYPAMLDVHYKSHLVLVESLLEHHTARQRAQAAAMFTGSDERAAMDQNYLVLRVARNDLVQSTLLEVGRKSGRLKKPLRVEFIGEPGIDEGGVRKEFFQLIVKSLMDPNFGMFLPAPSGSSTWIQPWIKNNHNKPEFRLIGQVIGLAVSNNIILDVQFPRVLYRKLLGLVPDFLDLEEIDPGFAGGLHALLSFQEEGEATVENTFCRMFTHEYDVFGQSVEVPLKPGGADIPLTAANREEYVSLIVQHVLNDAIRENFESFKDGFFSVVDRSIVPKMRPEELELLVCGQPFIHLEDLADGARYEGYAASDRVIQWFWDVLFDLTEDQKKLFLRFVTGSDRVPVGGLKELHFVLGRNGDDDAMLPTSHTCFNHLLLPKYSSKEVLRAKLLLAIENCTGFGLR